MQEPTVRSGFLVRRTTLAGLVVVGLILPDSFYSVVSEIPAEVFIVRLLLLVGVSLLAALPWVVSEAEAKVRRRLRLWAIPGVAASVVYFISTETLYLIVGFCLLVGAAMSVWAVRAHVASESLRTRLLPGERDR